MNDLAIKDVEERSFMRIFVATDRICALQVSITRHNMANVFPNIQDMLTRFYKKIGLEAVTVQSLQPQTDA